MTGKRDKRIPIMFSGDELAAIDEWRRSNRVSTRASTVRLLCADAMLPKALSGWQPIETAPRAGFQHMILLFWPHAPGKSVQITVGCWDAAMTFPPSFIDDLGSQQFGQPTHWMPLPAEPSPDDSDLIAESIASAFGDRCVEFDPECFCCKAWAQYDALKAPVHG